MIILDTNVVSEPMRARPDEVVGRWLASIEADELYTTAITCAELLLGLELLPQGRRHRELREQTLQTIAVDFDGRILPFDSQAAEHYATISANRRGLGRPMDKFDIQIAAIAASHGASVATRNVKDFADCGIPLIDPWNT